jgi:U3 small nucleolar RNA-associated protein 6
MELIFAEKVKARRIVLGINAPEKTPAITESGEAEEEQDIVESGGDVQVASTKIAQVIYRKAISEIPNSVELRRKFLEILESIDATKLMALEGEIYAGLRKDFVTDEDSWAWLAKRQFINAESKGLDCRKESTKVYEEALESVPSARMYELYAEFLIENLEHDDEVDGDESDLNQSAEALLALYKRAEAAGVKSETLARGKAGLLLRWGNVDSARESLEVACKGNASARTWTLLLALETKSSSVKTKDSSEPISKLLKAALKNASDDVQELLQIAAEVQTMSGKPFDSFLRLLESVLSGSSGKQAGSAVASALVDWVLHAEGLQRAREVYTRLIALPSPGLSFLKSCIAIEAGLVGDGNAEALKQLRKLFNIAVEHYGRYDDGLWLEYCAQERRAGNIEEAGNVYWRAKKALVNSTNFLEKHQLLR